MTIGYPVNMAVAQVLDFSPFFACDGLGSQLEGSADEGQAHFGPVVGSLDPLGPQNAG